MRILKFNSKLNYMNYKKIAFKDSYLLRRELLKNNKNFNLQEGGFKKIYEIDFKGEIYKFEKSDIDKNNFLLLSPQIKETCVLVSIIKKKKVAQIENINGDFSNCISFSSEKIGTFLLTLTLEFLKKYKDEFGIDWIIISDHSIKKCGNKFFKLMKLSFLTDGDSWYGKYKFFPINDFGSEIKYSKNGLKNYHYNKEIMKTIKLKDIKLKDYFIEVNKKYPKFDINMKVDENMLVKDFVKNFLIDFKLNCKYFYVFYQDLFDDIKLNVIDDVFGLKIK